MLPAVAAYGRLPAAWSGPGPGLEVAVGASVVLAGPVSPAEPAGTAAGAGDAGWGTGRQVAGAVARPWRVLGVRVARPLGFEGGQFLSGDDPAGPGGGGDLGAGGPGVAVSAAQTAAAGPSAGWVVDGARGGDACACAAR